MRFLWKRTFQKRKTTFKAIKPQVTSSDKITVHIKYMYEINVYDIYVKTFHVNRKFNLGSTTGSIGSNDLIQAVVSSSDRQFNSGNNQTYYSQFNSGLSHSLPLI